MITNELPEKYKGGVCGDDYQRILDEFAERGERITWTPSGPINKDGVDMALAFMYPSIIDANKILGLNTKG
jgi:hypothetical protein